MLFSYGKRYQCVVMQLGTVILNKRWGKKLNILEKLPKMHFEEKIVAKCVLTFLVTKTYY